MRRDRLAILAVLAWLVFSSPVNAATRRYAIIVAYAGDASAGVTPLEYADDDGARYHELFAQIADDVQLYTVLDASTQRLHPASARIARVPRRDAVLAGLASTFERAQRAITAGDEVIFYFVLVGHGKIGAGGEGEVMLLDGAFTRTDMFQQVLAKSPATTNHIIVDACNAYYLVHRRGDDSGPPRTNAVKAFLAKEDLARYPNTGVLLSTSTEKDTHEWSLYRAGVFSHELRSAMIGAADVNADGQITYSEVAAFLAAANQHVAETARLEVFAQPPAVDALRPLVDLRASKFAHWLQVPAGQPAHIYLEDERGVRYADANLGGAQSVMLGLVPSAYYYVRTADGSRELRVPLDRPHVELDVGAMKPPTVSSRGAVEESFRMHLFEEPFDANYYRGYAAATNEPPLTLEGPRWQPGPVHASLVDSELRRLNKQATTDTALQRRLFGARAALMSAITARDHARALAILHATETAP